MVIITNSLKTSGVTAASTALVLRLQNCNLGFYEETLIFQTSNFEILIQGIDALS
jgi:hypothetical protein